jgi:heme-degrading monooxygenase HmoA
MANRANSELPDRSIYVCFEHKIFATEANTLNKHYETLLSLLEHQSGFISQTPFVAVDQSYQQVLYVRFANAEDMHAWKNNHTHLRIQAYARTTGFSDFRVRLGHEFNNCEERDVNTTASIGKFLLLWQYPTPASKNTSTPVPRSVGFSLDPSDGLDTLVDAATYVGTTDTLRVTSWTDRETASRVRDAIQRIEGDDLRLIHVERHYGKFQREEAPVDADDHQNVAVANKS